MEKIHLNPKDSKDRYHGYQEWYDNSDRIGLRGVYKHGNEVGYEEYHDTKKTTFYIK